MYTKQMTYVCKMVVVWLAAMMVLPSVAQESQYKTFVYTSNELANEISKMNGERDASRGYFGDLFNSAASSMSLLSLTSESLRSAPYSLKILVGKKNGKRW